MPQINQLPQNEPQPIRPIQPTPIKLEQIAKIIPKNRHDVSTTLIGFQPLSAEKTKLKEPEILDGKGLNSLAEDIREYETALGDKVWAATDKGVNYLKDVNEDRVGVNPAGDMVIVADGVGGLKQGDQAAQKVAESYLDNPDDPDEAAKTASRIMAQENINGSACFAAMKITEKAGRKYLNVSQAGDVKVIVVRKGEKVFETTDHTKVQELVDLGVAKGGITSDAALYHPERNIVTNTISKVNHYPHVYEPFSLEKGDIVIGMSDGISDNLTPKEIIKRTRGAKGKQIIQVISRHTDDRMKNAKKYIDETKAMGGRSDTLKEYSDGFSSTPKPDNRGIAVIEIR